MVAATLVLGLGYPLVVYGFGAVAAPWQARGSLVTADGSHTTDPAKAVGSALVGQLVDDPDLFQPRPSAAGDGYDMSATSGSNLGPDSPELVRVISGARPRWPHARASRRATCRPDLGVLGEPHANVLLLNIAVRKAAQEG